MMKQLSARRSELEFFIYSIFSGTPLFSRCNSSKTRISKNPFKSELESLLSNSNMNFSYPCYCIYKREKR